MIRVHIATIIITTSWLTLVVFDDDAARDWMVPYALATLLLAAVGIIDGYRRSNRAR